MCNSHYIKWTSLFLIPFCATINFVQQGQRAGKKVSYISIHAKQQQQSFIRFITRGDTQVF
jgi:hypothetical protein